MNIFTTSQFTPSNNLNFQGYSRTLQMTIDKTLRKPNVCDADMLELSTSIKKATKSILTLNKFIGEGSHNTVYKITRKYAARIPLGVTINESELPDKAESVKGVFDSLHNYYGQVLFQLGKIQILRNIGKHMPAGVPEHFSKIFGQSAVNRYYKSRYLPRFSQITQASYNEFAKDIARLNEIKLGGHRFCLFDSINPNNIVACKGKLYLVDDINTLYDKSYGNTTAKLLEVFINKATKDYEAPDVGKKRSLVRKIFQKVVIAANLANLLHADSKEDLKNWERALKKCAYNVPVEEILNHLEKIQLSAPEERSILTKHYLNKLNVSNPL